MGDEKKNKLSDYGISAKIRFWLFSFVGLLIFVIPIKIGGNEQIGLMLIGGRITRLLGDAADYVIYAFALGGTLLFMKERKKRCSNFFDILMSLLSLLGIVCMTLYIFGIAPPFLEDERFMPFIMSQVLYPTLLYTGLSPLFMPFLLDSGLLEFVGVALRPVLRPLFKLPGRAAVITVSAFFGSAPVGIVVVDNLYKDGRFTHKEAFIVGTNFATTAISFMVILGNLGGILDYWGIYFLACLIGLAVIAVFMARLYPARNIPDTTFNGIDYDDENDGIKNGFLIKRMLLAGYEKAGAMGNLGLSCLGMIKTSAVLLCNIMASTCGMVVLGLAVNYYTSILEWCGYLFYPFALLAGLGDPLTVGKGAASALLVPSLPAVYAAGVSSLASKIVLCSMPVLGIISVPLTMPIFFNSVVRYRAKHLLIVYIERMILTILVVSVIVNLYIRLFI